MTQVLTAAQIQRLCMYMYSGNERNKEDSTNNNLFRLGLLKSKTNCGPSYYIISDKGIAYINMLESTPLPVERWVDPRNDGDVA